MIILWWLHYCTVRMPIPTYTTSGRMRDERLDAVGCSSRSDPALLGEAPSRAFDRSQKWSVAQNKTPIRIDRAPGTDKKQHAKGKNQRSKLRQEPPVRYIIHTMRAGQASQSPLHQIKSQARVEASGTRDLKAVAFSLRFPTKQQGIYTRQCFSEYSR